MEAAHWGDNFHRPHIALAKERQRERERERGGGTGGGGGGRGGVRGGRYVCTPTTVTILLLSGSTQLFSLSLIFV